MWYSRIKRFYDQKLWTEKQVRDAVTVGKITAEEFEEIVGNK